MGSGTEEHAFLEPYTQCMDRAYYANFTIFTISSTKREAATGVNKDVKFLRVLIVEPVSLILKIFHVLAVSQVFCAVGRIQPVVNSQGQALTNFIF